MASKGLGINVSDAGIGSILNQHMLMVPPNQRSYAWEAPHIQTLFEDLSSALSAPTQTYFLGTLVLTQGTEDRSEVADGQQRLATTSILIAAIRDHLALMGPAELKAAHKYTSEYLLIYDETTGEHTPRLQLNYEDNDYFLNNILVALEDRPKNPPLPMVSSHGRLQQAAQLAAAHVEKVVSQFGKADRAKELYRWVKFLREAAMVIAIRVPDHINAYTMFETLNDRGLRASQTDILKNFLFGKAQDRLKEIQMRWSSVVATIETQGDEDLMLTYLRHYWTLENGYTPERELASLVKERVSGRAQAMSMVVALDEHAADYTGLLSPLEYSGWESVDKQTRAYIYLITRILAVEQIRPLLLAIIRRFEPVQQRAAVRMLLSWSVRFLVAGSGGGGPLDRAYGQLSKEITDGTITKANQLRSRVGTGVIRADDEFRRAFVQARVTKTGLARYYLRAIEIEMQGLSGENSDLGGVLDESYTFNLEHVMPLSQTTNWNVDEQVAQQYRKRLGNMVLINPDVNQKLGNKPFAQKRKVYQQSPMLSTQAVGQFTRWGAADIEARQTAMAELATRIWSL